MAMVNYPYPTQFLSSLPGWPVKEACKFLSAVGNTDKESAAAMYQVANLYYNYTGLSKGSHREEVFRLGDFPLC